MFAVCSLGYAIIDYMRELMFDNYLNINSNNPAFFFLKIYVLSSPLILIYNYISLLPHVYSLTSLLILSAFWSLLFFIHSELWQFFNESWYRIHYWLCGAVTFSLKFLIAYIEIISNFLQPVSIAVRLTANLTAGHLLFNILGELTMGNIHNTLFWMILLMAIMLVFLLESCIAFMQAYVFTNLISIYIQSITH